MAVKPIHLKKLLVVLVLICMGMVALLYWGSLEEIYRVKPRAARWSAWTWDCENEQCVRRVREQGELYIPLSTCRMQCGPLPLWPMPLHISDVKRQSVGFGQVRVEILAEGKHVPEMLKEAAQVFKQNLRALLPEGTTARLGELVVVVKVALPTYLLSLNTDESYTLNLTYLRAEITAKTFFGARHGLETLSQLVWWNDVSLRVFQRAYIKDRPQFRYRGVLLDTARNFIPVPSLLRTLDALAASKLNVFHWHISDSQSFPFDSPRVPQMARYGAYSLDKIYSADDIRHVVSYARVRGVRVLIEIDAPAHAGNGWQWGERHGMGNLSVCVNKQPWNSYCGEPPCGQLNPDNPHMYQVLGKLYQDLVELTNMTDMFHLGGDEVDLNCWASALEDKRDPMAKWKYFQRKALMKLTAANKGKAPDAVVLWHSPFTRPENLNKKIHVVQTWGASNWGEEQTLLDKNIRIIISNLNYWYLDCGFGNWRGLGNGACGPMSSWQNVYQHRPWVKFDRSLILGGEVCLWGEMMDENSLDMKLWPRAAAFAERIWSDTDTEQSIRDAHGRLAVHRDLLVSRGIRPDTMWPEWCSQNPYMCLDEFTSTLK
ncbi:hypothetical protein L9F63_000271, partial [Diploptera punctata]